MGPLVIVSCARDMVSGCAFTCVARGCKVRAVAKNRNRLLLLATFAALMLF